MGTLEQPPQVFLVLALHAGGAVRGGQKTEAMPVTTPKKPAAQRSPFSSHRKRRLRRRERWWNAPWFDVLQLVLLVVSLLWLTVSGAMAMGYTWQWYRIPGFFWRIVDGKLVWGPLVEGLAVTLKITACSAFLALAIGMATALLRLSDSIAGRTVAKIYLEAVRNTPLLVQIYVFYFVFGPIIGLDRFWVGVACLAVFEGAFACEVIRGGIVSVPRGQMEAAHSVGLGRLQSYRHVILPQAGPLMLPPLTGVLISLVRNSAMVSVIAVFDLTNEARNIVADTFLTFEVWLTVAVVYLALTISLSILMSRLEHRVRTGARTSRSLAAS